ncbi:hypothetical protein E4U09_006043 [Claviceps aff. purpurea]|uniref:Uncharacterized protein n=1 Tax=Claviceps aff. purpurea TaxID=1967640 RepID=A0A9P7TZM0_9HYPO|nr:hypothetical protein E4U09_006043 [Claviceps aff. purpurea]
MSPGTRSAGHDLAARLAWSRELLVKYDAALAADFKVGGDGCLQFEDGHAAAIFLPKVIHYRDKDHDDQNGESFLNIWRFRVSIATAVATHPRIKIQGGLAVVAALSTAKTMSKMLNGFRIAISLERRDDPRRCIVRGQNVWSHDGSADVGLLIGQSILVNLQMTSTMPGSSPAKAVRTASSKVA